MDDIGPCERIEGAVARAGPTGFVHGVLESRLNRRLGMFVEDANSGWRLVGEVGVYIRRGPARFRGADLAFWSSAKLPHGPRAPLCAAAAR